MITSRFGIVDISEANARVAQICFIIEELDYYFIRLDLIRSFNYVIIVYTQCQNVDNCERPLTGIIHWRMGSEIKCHPFRVLIRIAEIIRTSREVLEVFLVFFVYLYLYELVKTYFRYVLLDLI